ncbi:MAG: hypothetical protein KJ063_25150, partial [Anaerolineae bacterium]|nr:hypothetical protein [Anaerolineae bacterium]
PSRPYDMLWVFWTGRDGRERTFWLARRGIAPPVPPQHMGGTVGVGQAGKLFAMKKRLVSRLSHPQGETGGNKHLGEPTRPYPPVPPLRYVVGILDRARRAGTNVLVSQARYRPARPAPTTMTQEIT